MHPIPVPQERTFQLRNGSVLAAKHWTTATARSVQQLGPEPVEILALDLAGHGMSSHRQSEDYSLWLYVEDLDQVAEQLRWDRHALIGHSMGGAISTLYAGLFESRVLLCILLDNFGPVSRAVENQPQHFFEHLEKKKNLTHKRIAFHPTIESACDARSKGGDSGLHPASAKILVPRGLRPVEITNPNVANMNTDGNNNNTLQGWTWSTARALTILPAQTLSNAYVRAFLNRVTSPVLAVLATELYSAKSEIVTERMGWFCKTKVTIKRVDGSHSVHMENPQLISGHVCSWILDQDAAVIARL